MAIDTINEKLALLEYGESYQPGIPISNDGLDQGDKQQLLWEYPGILWKELVADEPEIIEQLVFKSIIQIVKPFKSIIQIVKPFNSVVQNIKKLFSKI